MKTRLIVLLLLLCATPAHATVNEVFARNDYVGNASTTSFPYTFRIINQADVLVLLNGALQTLNVAYTVIGVDNPAGGAVVFATAPPAGQNVVLLRAQRFQQLSIYTPNEAFPAKRIESDLDKNAMVDQRQQEEIGRALKFDPHSLYRNVFVDDPVANQCLAWNAARTRVVSAACSGGPSGPPGTLTGNGADKQVAFWTSATNLAGDGKLLWDNLGKFMTVGTFPLGPTKPGNAFMGLVGPTDATGMQNLQLQTVQGDPSLIGLVTLGDDRVGISSWNFRGTGATNPIYGANFGVVFNTDGVANGLEIDVQNDSATNFQGQALWLNGSTRAVGASGTVGHRANAILIDTQDGSKWERGILFKEGFVANGSTGSVEKIGIHFENSQDADFIVIQPRVGLASAVAMKVTNPEFTLNRFELLNSGTLRVSNSMTGPAFPSYSFIEGAGPTAGMYLEAVGTAFVPPSTPATGAILGWAVNSLRRLTLGDALNVWNSGVGASQGGTINFFDPTAVHSVGLMAPDFVGNTFRIKLPNAPGSTGQCLITNGAFPVSEWSYAACGTGGGGGSGTVTNTGVLGLNQIVLGNGGVDIKGLGSLGTATTVLHGNAGGIPTWGQVVVADIGATGTPSSSTFLRGDGTWSAVAGSGTVTTSGSPVLNHVAFFTAPTVVSGGSSFQWDNAIKRLTVGLGNDATSPSKVAHFNSRSIGGSDPTVQIAAAFAGASPTVNHPVAMTMIGDFLGGGAMPSGFGVTMEFGLHDNAGAGTFIPAGFINSTVQTITPATTSMTFGTMQVGVATPIATLAGSVSTFNTPVAITGVSLPTGANFGVLSPIALAGNQHAVRLEARTGVTAGRRSPLALVHTSTGSMADLFSVSQDFIVRDTDGVDNINARILAGRAVGGGTDNTGYFTIQTAIAGTLADRLTFDLAGQMVYVPTSSVGALLLTASGTTRSTLKWHTDSNVSAVGFRAPATSFGNITWTLPGTLGAAGSVLSNDGAGNLSWATGTSVTTTGTPAANQFAFFTGANTISSNAAFAFNAGTGVVSLLPPGSLVVGGTPFGGQAAGPVNVTVSTSDNVTPYQSILGQVVNGSSAGAVPATIANDKVAVSGWAFRGAGGTSPIYGGHFGVKFETTGVVNGVEIGVQNGTGVNGIGNGLWINGSGSNNRDNAVLIDTQNGTKWQSGIRFLEGDVPGGATGSILNYGIIFDKSQDADFIVIRPRVGVTTNRAIRITDSAFSTNKFELWNDGTINTFGSIQTANNIGAVQYFSSGIGGFTGGANLTKAGGGSCVLTITGGIVTGSNC